VQQKRVTIKEIPKIVGILPMMVPIVLKGRPGQRKKRAMIVKIAEELGFIGTCTKGLRRTGSIRGLYGKGIFKFLLDNNAAEATIEMLSDVMQENIDNLIIAPGLGKRRTTTKCASNRGEKDPRGTCQSGDATTQGHCVHFLQYEGDGSARGTTSWLSFPYGSEWR
jgi:hypothetical protein